MLEQLKDLNIEESDREDSLLIISELNTVMEYIQNVNRQSSEILKNEELLEKYLVGLSSALLLQQEQIVPLKCTTHHLDAMGTAQVRTRR